jgi:hypothetical protein
VKRPGNEGATLGVQGTCKKAKAKSEHSTHFFDTMIDASRLMLLSLIMIVYSPKPIFLKFKINSWTQHRLHWYKMRLGLTAHHIAA